MLYTKIKTCSRRPGFAQRGIKTLGLSQENIWYDIRETNPEYKNKLFSWNVAKGWESFININCDHCMFMDDDLEYCDNFFNIVDQIIQTHPDAAIGLFPIYYRRITVQQNDSPYWEDRNISGACIILPKKYIKDVCEFMFSRCDKIPEDDLLIWMWCSYNHIPMITTIPSLVQHIGDKSLYNPNAPIRRTQYFEKNPIADWSNKKINKWEPKKG